MSYRDGLLRSIPGFVKLGNSIVDFNNVACMTLQAPGYGSVYVSVVFVGGGTREIHACNGNLVDQTKECKAAMEAYERHLVGV